MIILKISNFANIYTKIKKKINQRMIKNKITKFVINTEKSPYIKSKDLVKYLDSHIKRQNFKQFIDKIAVLSSLPQDVIGFEIKQILMRSHDFKIGKFKKIFNFYNIFKSSLRLFILTFYIFMFSKKKKEFVFADIIFDEVESHEELNRIYNLKKNFLSYKIITEKKNIKEKNIFLFYKFKNCDRDYILSNFYDFVFGYLLEAIKFSFKEKTNYIPLVEGIIKKNIKYRTIFKQINSKYLYQERHYTTSAIKNYLFKKFGGKKTFCLQKNIVHLHDTGFYINTDIFFTLGKKTSLTVKFCGSKIEKTIPVGSIYLESKWFKTKKIKVPEYDIVYFNGNKLAEFATNKNFIKNYYKTFKWIVKISKEFPDLKIAIKHHLNNKNIDKNETRIFKNSNVKTIVSAGKSDKNYSYGFAFKTKFACTFASTIGYELIGHKKPCFFLDPDGKNIEFLNNESYNSKWKIKSYKSFKHKVKNILFNKIKNSINSKQINNSEDFCLKSDNVSLNIINHLKK